MNAVHRVLTLLALVCLWLVGCQPRKDMEAQPDMLLVLVSGLRADPMEQPGAEAALLAPFGDLPRRSFGQAYSQSISPHLSLGSLLTGIYPSAIPLCGYVDFDRSSLDAQPWCSALPKERATLPLALAAYGWRTAHLHRGYLEQAALAGHFQHSVELAAGEPGFATPWAQLREQLLGWWEQSDEPRLVLLQLADPMDAVPRGRRGPGAPPDSAEAEASYLRIAGQLGVELAALIDELEGASSRPLLVVLTSPHGIQLEGGRRRVANVSQLMAPALLDESTLHVPLHLLGSAVRESGGVDTVVELRAVLPTLLARADAVPPAGVEPLDLLSQDPAALGPGRAYAEVGDMLSLRQGDLLLRFRTMIHHSTALNSDLTDFLQHPVSLDRASKTDIRFYNLFDVTEGRTPPRDQTGPRWAEALELRQTMIEIRTGPGAPHAKATEPERLLELRMTASEGYW